PSRRHTRLLHLGLTVSLGGTAVGSIDHMIQPARKWSESDLNLAQLNGVEIHFARKPLVFNGRVLREAYKRHE
ncbi:MAG TPA: hypothetical protein VN843_36540, partial [Anaerolineales bacterium]|nr:hypothetical protein [Anaerolineales bacterium]